jgi:hypothetical protein
MFDIVYHGARMDLMNIIATVKPESLVKKISFSNMS